MRTIPHNEPLQAEVNWLSRRSQTYLSDLLVRGIIGYYAFGRRDAFYPHAFITATEDPIDTLIATYASGLPSLKRKLCQAILACTATVLPGSNASRPLDVDTRLALLRVLSVLIARFYCFDAGRPLLASVTDKASSWDSREALEEVFALALRCIADLAIEGETSGQLDLQVRLELESQLVRLINDECFRVDYSPLCVHALVCLDPRAFFHRYRGSLGLYIQKMHLRDPSQKAYAYATVDRLVRRAPLELIYHCPRLEISGEEQRDRWIIEALLLPESGYVLYRMGRDPTCLYLMQRAMASEQIRGSKPSIKLKNDAFVHFTTRTNLPSVLPHNERIPGVYQTELVSYIDSSHKFLHRSGSIN